MPDTGNSEQVVLVCVGLIASGKSTFAQALQEHFPNFRRCNQDELGDRRQVERLARESLHQGFSVCIDRTNFDAQQRSTWINIARESSAAVCVERLRNRTSHPTITDVEHGLMVLARFRSQFRPPTSDEGYDRILQLKSSERSSAEYSFDDVALILERLRVSMPPPISSHSFRGFRSRGGWGGGARGAVSSTRGSGIGDRPSKDNVWRPSRGGRTAENSGVWRPSRGRGILVVADEEDVRKIGASHPS